jgi:hypothetical protein
MRLQKSLILISIAGTLAACGGSSDTNQAPVFTNNSYSFAIDEDTNFTGNVSATDAESRCAKRLSYTPVGA